MKQIEKLFQIIRRGSTQEFLKVFDKKMIDITNVDGQSLLHEAISYNKNDIAEILIRNNINLNIQDNNGQTALHYAAMHMNVDIAKLILQNGGTINVSDNYGNEPLWTAVFNARGKYDLVRLYIEFGADSYYKNKAKRSPIDFAMQIKDMELVKILESKDV